MYALGTNKNACLGEHTNGSNNVISKSYVTEKYVFKKIEKK